jgi:hypothetical protein
MTTKKIVDFDFDFGIDFSEDLTDVVSQHKESASNAQVKAETMYKMIMPLLNNLKKNPDKPNIVWPDREKKIDEFIKKLDTILNS